MARYRAICVLVLLLVASGVRGSPEGSLKLQKSAPYQNASPSWMTRLTGWLFPFDGAEGDSAAAEGRLSATHHHQAPPAQRCNPCNQEPWIPVATNYGPNTVLNFLPPSSHQPEIFWPPPAFRPRPDKLNYGLPKPPPPPIYSAPGQHSGLSQFMVPPPLPAQPTVTHLRPILHTYGVPIDMKPPPLSGSYHSLPTLPTLNGYLPPAPPPPGPSDSYGRPVVGPNSDFQIAPEFLPPLQGPLPLPNLNSGPVLPIHDYQQFRLPEPDQYLPPIIDQYPKQTQINADFARPQSDTHQPDDSLRHELQQLHTTDQIPQQGANYEVAKATSNVQIIPSIKIADYLSSVEHPIDVIQSPIVDVSVKEEIANGNDYGESKLSENPIIVDDTHAAASAVNVSINDNQQLKRDNGQSAGIASFDQSNHKFSNDSQIGNRPRSEIKSESLRSQSEQTSNILQQILFRDFSSHNDSFTPPPLDYTSWQPSWGGTISTSMVPPPVSQTTWLHPVKATTKEPKQIQIIVPYIKKPFTKEMNQGRMVPSAPQAYTTLLPVYMPPPSNEELIWAKFADDYSLAESRKVPAMAFTLQPSSTQVSNIRDLLKGSKHYPQDDFRPFDVISLQNHIDDWTQSAFQKTSTNAKFVPSKKIPDEYFTTEPFLETTTATSIEYESAGSNDIETNLIFSDTTVESPSTTTTTEASTKPFPSPFAPKDQKSLWSVARVTVSPVTKEKVYIVTPQPARQWSLPPKIQTNATKFLIRVEPDNRSSRARLNDTNNGGITVVFSEWPHLINNLQTTTTKRSPTVRHPLFGLMDLGSYSPSPNATVQTILGHSKVVTVVTPASSTENANVPMENGATVQ